MLNNNIEYVVKEGKYYTYRNNNLVHVFDSFGEVIKYSEILDLIDSGFDSKALEPIKHKDVDLEKIYEVSDDIASF